MLSMAKNAKKAPAKGAKKVIKKASKPAAKPLKAAAKAPAKKGPAKPAGSAAKSAKAEDKGKTKSLTKTVVSAVGKLFGKEATPAPKKEKAPKKGKGKKKDSKDGMDFEDDLLASDEEIGAEEIPDLSEFEENEVEEVESADLDSDTEVVEVKPAESDEIFLTDAEGRRYCRVRDCDQISAVEGYCRYHYLLLWKRIQVRRKILVDGKLERYVEELTSRYPDKFLEMIRKDLRSEKDFLGAIAELEIDESAGENEMEDETQSFVDEIRGISGDTGSISDEEEF